MGTPRSGYIHKDEVPIVQRFAASGLHKLIAAKNCMKQSSLSIVYYDGILVFDYDTRSWETKIHGKFKWRSKTVVRRRKFLTFLTYKTTEYQLTWEDLFVPRAEGAVVSSEIVHYNVEPQRFVRFFCKDDNRSVDFMWNEKREKWKLVRTHLMRID
jgi:hypothetical protein